MAASLRVTIDGIAGGGTIRVGLYDEATFPTVSDTALFRRETPASGASVTVTFDRVPPGGWAVKAYQDLNNNNRRDADEPQAISNGAAATDFDAAAIALMPGMNTIALHLH